MVGLQMFFLKKNIIYIYSNSSDWLNDWWIGDWLMGFLIGWSTGWRLDWLISFDWSVSHGFTAAQLRLDKNTSFLSTIAFRRTAKARNTLVASHIMPRTMHVLCSTVAHVQTPTKTKHKNHQKPVLACLGAIPETQSPETPDLLRPTHEIAFETHSTLTSPKTVFCPASRSGLVADCSWLFPWAACLNISSMSWIEERHGREELETSSQDCPHQDGDRKHRELKHILFWISDAAFASFSKLATSIGYFMLFSCNCQENVWSWRFPLRVENRSNVSHSGRSFTAESRIGQFLIITSCNWVWPWS